VEVSKEDDAPVGRSSNGCKREDAGREKCMAGTCTAAAATSIATPPSPLAALRSLQLPLSLSSLLASSNQDMIPYFPRGEIGILGFGALVSPALRRRLVGDVILPLQIGILGFEEA
jgi:hypothetical protein